MMLRLLFLGKKRLSLKGEIFLLFTTHIAIVVCNDEHSSERFVKLSGDLASLIGYSERFVRIGTIGIQDDLLINVGVRYNDHCRY